MVHFLRFGHTFAVSRPYIPTGYNKLKTPVATSERRASNSNNAGNTMPSFSTGTLHAALLTGAFAGVEHGIALLP
ncbi:hypothetical protein [Kordiimonas pumila]|uniref:hypothetical protein n=1 Tax=Kordiimonas pumila TaxID=2161677 RepID=UPI0018833DC5|nr:hypothetical protein [Kordiimonas pumila]